MRKGVAILLLLTGVTAAFAQLTWCGESLILANGDWYSGSCSQMTAAGYYGSADLGTLTELSLGGQVQSADQSGDIAFIRYRIDEGTAGSIELPFSSQALNDTWQLSPGSAVDISGLASGSHSLTVWFEVIDTDEDPQQSVFDDNYGSVGYTARLFGGRGRLSLPVTLSSVTGTYRDGAVDLHWETASETGNRAFRIYRNKAMIDEIGGAGTTSGPRSYHYTDRHVIPGKTYTYVIADVSYENEERKHEDHAVTVSIPETLTEKHFIVGMAYPNPFNPLTVIPLNLAYHALVEAVLYDFQGQKAQNLYRGLMNPGSHDLKINGESLSTGIYFVRVCVENVVNVRKITLMK
ncbi:MAG: T9SS type A sorting domain-containing protein [Candidatus Marinimicrobia bacterium]|nr:T9SS type A sorting domain-containing protein [Candidatus Neomarinimicrobiota bacterium]